MARATSQVSGLERSRELSTEPPLLPAGPGPGPSPAIKKEAPVPPRLAPQPRALPPTLVPQALGTCQGPTAQSAHTSLLGLRWAAPRGEGRSRDTHKLLTPSPLLQQKQRAWPPAPQAPAPATPRAQHASVYLTAGAVLSSPAPRRGHVSCTPAPAAARCQQPGPRRTPRW